MKRRHGLLVATAATMMIWSGISAARADSCKSLAAEVAGTIDDFKIGRHVSNAIYIEHPQFRRGLFGCTSHKRANDIYAESRDRKPDAAFYDVMAQAGAIIFSVPMNDVRKGALRCARMSARRLGREVSTRYRRMNIVCALRKDGLSLTVSRERG